MPPNQEIKFRFSEVQYQSPVENNRLPWQSPRLKRLSLNRGTAIGHGTIADSQKPDGDKQGPHS
jgi:hypothetical protein